MIRKKPYDENKTCEKVEGYRQYQFSFNNRFRG